MSEDISELQKEWRAIVLSKLSSLEASLSNVQKDIVDVKLTFAQQKEIDELTTKVDKLEAFKARLMGIDVGLNILGVFIGYVLEHMVFKE